LAQGSLCFGPLSFRAMDDVDGQTAVAVLRALQLHAWSEKLNRRIQLMDDFQADVDSLEADINTNGNRQRELITSELDHLKDLLDCKKEQLLSKGKLEQQQKMNLVETQRRQLEPETTRTHELRERVAKIQNLNSCPTFLSVCQRTMTDLRGFLAETKPLYLPTDAEFRPFTVDAAHRALGNLDLSPHPTKVSARRPAATTANTAGAPRHSPEPTEVVLHHSPSLPLRSDVQLQFVTPGSEATIVDLHGSAFLPPNGAQLQAQPSPVYAPGATVMRGGQQYVQYVQVPPRAA